MQNCAHKCFDNQLIICGAQSFHVKILFVPGTKQDKIVQNTVGQRNLRGLRQKTVDRLGINPGIASLPLLQLIWLSVVAIFNWAHGKFSVKYATERMQSVIVEKILRRVNLPNLFLMDFTFEFPLSYPRKGSKEMDEWTPVALRNLKNWLATQGFPLYPLPHDQRTVDALMDLEEGAFSAKQVPHYSLLVCIL